ncbi:WD40 repeat protein [Ceratobasidium sp. AG-Ba]|nr:WD40 repeat protein [Ceratobasidium sp. AG-Ba]
MDDDSSYVEMIDRYPGPDPAALYLAPLLVSNTPPARPFASTRHQLPPSLAHRLSPTNLLLTLTSLKSVEVLAGTNRRGLISSGKDGRIRIWDERTGSAGAFTAASGQTRPLVSFAVSPDGWTIAAGAELGRTRPHRYLAKQRRMPPLFLGHDVTQLEFHPTLGSGAPGGLLLSASADGLLALTSVDEPNEDEAVQYVGNWNTSIAHVGWTVRPEEIAGGDPMNFKVWAASDMQTLSVWSDELALEHDYGDLRRTKIPQTWESDYLINAQWFGYTHAMPWETNALGLWCGNNKGDIGLVSVQDTLSWRLDRVLSGGHTGVVRTCTWDPTG